MFSNGFFVLILSFFLSVALAADPSSAPTADPGDIFYVCKRERSIRWLRAYKLENGKCKALYSKEGYLQVISSATYFTSCEGVLMSVKKNLEEGRFKCILVPMVSVIELDAD